MFGEKKQIKAANKTVGNEKLFAPGTSLTTDIYYNQKIDCHVPQINVVEMSHLLPLKICSTNKRRKNGGHLETTTLWGKKMVVFQ